MREAEHCELCFSFFIPYAGTKSEYASIESVSDQNFPPPPPCDVPDEEVCVLEPPPEDSFSFGFAVLETVL